MEREECDRTYLILSFRVSETTSAYVQFLSDPLHRTVLWEVSSLDYQAGLGATPSRVQVARDPDARDPIPFVRLLLPGPVARITLTWEDR